MGSIMEKEITETPHFLELTVREAKEKVGELAVQIRSGKIKTIYLAARGSSMNAGLYFKYICETDTPMTVCEINPSVLTVYNGRLDMSGGCLLAVSQGGRGVDIRMVLERAVQQNALSAAVTAFPDSPIGSAAQIVLPLKIDIERSMAATKSFTSQLLVLNMLAADLAGKEDCPQRLIQAFEKGLEKEDSIFAAAKEFKAADVVYVIGRGKTLPTARELCCKLQETCLINAFPFSAAEFMHGPFALVEKESRAILFHSRYGASGSVLALYDSLRSQGAKVLFITDDEEFCKDGADVICVPGKSEDEAVFSMTAVLQLFACALAALRGTDPDTSRNLNKYTETI